MSAVTPSAGHTPPGRALITGSAAPFARRLVERLEALGWEVSTIVHEDPDLVPPTHSLHMPGTAPDGLSSVVAAVDAVVLLSGIDSLTSMVDDSRDLDDVLGHLTPGATLVEVTTMAVFGDAGTEPISELDTPVVPADLDPVAACEIRVLACDDWLRGIVVRPGLVYGQGGGAALGPAIELARSLGASRYFGDGTDVLPMVHEDDLLTLLAQVVTDRSARGVYHATSGSTTTRELAGVVAAAAGIDTVESWTPEALQTEFGTISQPPRVSIRADHARSRATTELGWRPTGPSPAEALVG